MQPFQVLFTLLNLFHIHDGSYFVIKTAGLLGFNNDDIALFQRSLYRPGGSPTDDMLTTWDYENHTIEELYLKLYELKHARCMMYLKDYGKSPTFL